ncbi:TolC family protein [Pleomorphovibrio marinus]|uniref:TolC family protein n=1 Tax=Pleomorphovibrio marinus TaxID=2164132 RepID=UPI000E0BD595|nr:TolC family protein [Pleomorphovibrio marinus]
MKIKLLVLVLFIKFSLLKVAVGQEVPAISSLSLQECLEIALENNLNLRRANLSLESVEAGLLEAKGQMLPSFSTGISSGFRWGRSINPVTNLFETRRIGNVNVSASANLPIYTGRQIQNRIKQSEVDLQSNRLTVEATENDISLNAINLFINVAFAKEQLNIADNQLNTIEAQLAITNSRVQAGGLPMAELLEIQAQRATSELEVINARNNFRIARLNLSQFLMIPFSDEFGISIPEVELENLELGVSSVEEIYSEALSHLPQIRAAELEVESAEYGIKIAQGAYYPTLGINANVFSNYVDQAALGPVDPVFRQFENNISQTVNMALNIPIFSNFRNRAGLQRARVQKRISEVADLETRNQLRQDIETAYTSAYAARQSFNSSELRVEALKEAFRMSQQRFEVGAINATDYQIAQNNLFNAEADLLTAKYEYVFRMKVLDFYLGKPLTL